MRRFRDIIESPFPVPTNCLWIKGTNLKGFINGNWVNLGGNDRKINWSDIEGGTRICSSGYHWFL